MKTYQRVILGAVLLFGLAFTANAAPGGGNGNTGGNGGGVSVSYVAPTSATETTVDGFKVTTNGAQYISFLNMTVFTWAVTSDNAANDLSHFTIGLPDCDEVRTAIVNVWTNDWTANDWEIGTDPTTGVYGIKWDNGLSKAPYSSRLYYVLLQGEWGVGTVQVAVKAGSAGEWSYINGISCGGAEEEEETYSISGTAFVDADGDGNYDTNEPPLANTTVFLYDADGEFVAETLTASDGSYEFENLADGTYYVSVPAATDNDGDFNETLNTYFDATTNTTHEVTIDGADETDWNFGYEVDTDDILDDFDGDDNDGDGFTFTGTGKTIGFWKHQLAVAIRGKGKAQVDADTMGDYIAGIESFFLADPFTFTSDFSDAWAAMAKQTSDAVELLEKQLLGTEFNEMAGRGLTGDWAQLQTTLLMWGEYLAANGSDFTRDELLDAKDIFDLINNSGE